MLAIETSPNTCSSNISTACLKMTSTKFACSTIKMPEQFTGMYHHKKHCLYRGSNTSIGMISRTHFDQIENTLHFFEAVSKLNEEACGDRPHPTPIT